MSENARYDKPRPGSKLVCVYDYRDGAGEVVFRKKRFDPKAFLFERPVNGKWISGIGGGARVPYRLPELQASESAIITEGEKDSDALAQLGFPSTSGPFGAGSWPKELTPHFKDKLVFVLFDVGEEKAAEHVADKLFGTAREVRLCTLPSERREFDVSDLLATVPPDDPDLEAKQKALVIDILKQAKPYKRPSAMDFLVTSAAIRALDISVEYILEDLLPEQAITVLSGPGGIGKTYLGLQIAKAVSEGRSLFGLAVKPLPVVYVDFENPLPLLRERLARLDLQTALHWTLGAAMAPPKLDGDGFALYKELPRPALLLFDSLRSGHSGDENSSKDMALVLNRLKELRELGLTILVLHHTPKSTERLYKGSTAISDLADHTLTLCRVRPSNYKPDEDLEPEPGQPVYFGCNGKTRYGQSHVYLVMNEDGSGFAATEHPDEEMLRAIQGLIRTAASPPSQKEICELAKSELDIAYKGKALALLERGERLGYWRTSFVQPPRGGKRRIYVAL